MADDYVKTIGPTAAPFKHYWRIAAHLHDGKTEVFWGYATSLKEAAGKETLTAQAARRNGWNGFDFEARAATGSPNTQSRSHANSVMIVAARDAKPPHGRSGRTRRTRGRHVRPTAEGAEPRHSGECGPQAVRHRLPTSAVCSSLRCRCGELLEVEVVFEVVERLVIDTPSTVQAD
jgi:hypothetical protein